LTSEEGERILRIVTESLLIKRHFQLFLWLQGGVQHFLPHRLLLSASGDIPQSDVKVDVVSALPGVRTEQLGSCCVDGFIKELYSRWVEAGRAPLVVPQAIALARLGPCHCPVHAALRSLHSILVHGLRDERHGDDSFYVASHCQPVTNGHPEDRFKYLVSLLIPLIDAAFRRVAVFRFPGAPAAAGQGLGGEWLNFSAREHEILGCLRKGDTNVRIGLALNISPFTVKNHVRRILRKLGADNRTQAATKYSEAIQESGNIVRK
jgi:transcriptional regulator EpsA